MTEAAKAAIKIRFETEVPEADELGALVAKCASTALAEEQFSLPAQIDITVVDDETIRELNAEYRDKDVVTDVLSFPLYEFVNGETLENLAADAHPETGRVLLGDMILNYKRACEQATEYGHSPARECGFLTVHSCLHLLGYDHERGETDQKLMREREEAILGRLGLTRD